MNKADSQYIDLVKHILENGVEKSDRTGTGTKSVFGYQMRFDLAEGFPILTTKFVPFRIVAEELFWFLSGSTDVKDLLDKDIDIWTKDAYQDYLRVDPDSYQLTFAKFRQMAKKSGWDLGRIYGAQWRSWGGGYTHEGGDGIDQIATVIDSIKNNPDSRRHIVSGWNVSDLEDMALPPCHTLFQFYVADGKLSCQLYQRSADVFLGLPFNIASYALLTHLIAHVCGLEVGEFIHTIGDAHIYLNHIEQVTEQISREPKPLPSLWINPYCRDIDVVNIDLISLDRYDPHPAIKGEQSA